MIATSLPDLDLLRAFSVFARHLNFTRAARELHLSQPALHAQVARLSSTLGLALYTREGRGLALTQDGARVAGFARDITAQATVFLSAMRGEETVAPVVLSAGEGSYLYLLGEGIKAYLSRKSSPLRLVTHDREGTLAAVREGAADLGVAPLEGAVSDLRSVRLAEVSLMLAMPSSHPLAEKSSVKLKALSGSRLIVPPEGKAHRTVLTEALSAQRVVWDVAVEVTGWELMLRFVELGLGLAVVNSFCRMPRGVVARPLKDLPSRVYHLVSRRSGARSLAHEALAASLMEHCARWR